jgi:hypothetical protein
MGAMDVLLAGAVPARSIPDPDGTSLLRRPAKLQKQGRPTDVGMLRPAAADA